MTVESITYYARKNRNEEIAELIFDRGLETKLLIYSEDAGVRATQKIKSKDLITRKEFYDLIDVLKNNQTEMLNVTVYLNTEAEIRLKQKLEEHYKTEKSIDMVVDSAQFYKIFTHTDLDSEVTDLIKNYEGNIPLMESEIPSNSQAFFRVNITGLRIPKSGYEQSWDFIKEICKSAYFIKEEYKNGYYSEEKKPETG